MKLEIFEKFKPEIDDPCKVVYLFNKQKFEEEAYFSGIDEGKILFSLKNWANDLLILKPSQLLYCKNLKSNQVI